MLKATVRDKQIAINNHINTNEKLKQELETVRIETERVDKKLISYSTASYVLDHILPKPTTKDESGEDVYGYGNKGLGYHQLPDDIDVTYTKSDIDYELELVKKVVEKVLENESDTANYESCKSKFEKGSSSSQYKSDESFHKNYIPKSVSSLKDDPKLVMYKMNGSDKLYSDEEFLIHNVNLNKVEKVFKLVEVEISEIEICQKIKDFSNFKRD
ncbi:hypothetical protein Hanom_Chr01g00039491 [Helianthus anomalus]